jgi:hypothetical protein
MKTLAICILGIALTGCTSGFRSAGHDEIVYRKKDTSVLEIYNLKRNLESSEGYEYLRRRDAGYGEWGGSIHFCSNDEYFCMDEGLLLVIPKKFAGQSDWEFLGTKCHSGAPLKEMERVTITCATPKWSTRFVYWQHMGVTSYVIAVQPDDEYVLIDERGLFAR